MANILLTWELGSGLGHLFPLKLVAQELVKNGHRVTAAIRETANATLLFADTPIRFLAAPAKHRVTLGRIDPPTTYAHLLHNIGFGDADELAGLHHSWRTIFDLVQPDLVLADHSPTALLSLRGSKIPVATIGTGFCSPPASDFLPKVRPWVKGEDQACRDHEEVLRLQVNQLLEQYSQPPLARMSDLFNEVTTEILTTFPELDHFGPRENGQFWGCFPSGASETADWPQGLGPKIYAYLSAIPDRERYLQTLAQLGFPTIAVAGPVSQPLKQQFRNSTINLVDAPINVEQATRQCDIVINYGGHGVTALALLAGKPLLQIPIAVEQFLLASCVAKLGAGIFIPGGNQQIFIDAISSIIHKPQYRLQAEAFAHAHSKHSPRQLAERISTHLQSLLQ